jgi:flagellar biosynthetic protein FliR
MLTFTEAQVLAWVTPILWPFIRVLALFGSLPIIAQRSVPLRLRIGLAGLIAFCAQATIRRSRRSSWRPRPASWRWCSSS